MLKSRPWYKKWWGITLAVLILPIFGLWYVWVELERNKVFRIGATAFLLALYAGGVMTFVYALPNSLHSSNLTANHLSTSSKSSPTSKLSSSGATSNDLTQSNKTSQTTSKASSTTSSNKTATTPSTPTTSSTSSQTSGTAPPETLLQQYPDTYPNQWANVPMDTVIDTWGMLNRESVSYTAYKVNEVFGNMPTTFSGLGCQFTIASANGPPVIKTYPGGDAICWPQDAQNLGISTGTTAELHSVAISNRTPTGLTGPGFSAWVEAVSGNQVTVSSYNSDGTGNYSVFTEPASYFATYIYFAGN